MAKVEQKVGLDTTEYEKGVKRLSRTAKTETDRVGKEFDKAGDDVRDFSNRTKRNIGSAQGAFKGLAKGFRASLGKISAVGVGLAIGAAITKEVVESLNFESVINQAAARFGLSETAQAQFRNQLIDVSIKTGAEEEQVFKATSKAIDLGASIKEAVKIADVVATTAEAIEGVDIISLVEKIGDDLKARGVDITAEAFKESIESVLAGLRAQIGSFNEILDRAIDLPARVQKRAKLTQRDLIEIFSGAGGVAADPEILGDAIKALVVATDNLGEKGVIKGFLGVQLRDKDNKFSLTKESLNQIAESLSRLGDEQVQRATLATIPGFESEKATEGLLVLVRNIQGFEERRARTKADRPDIEEFFEKATSGFSKQLGLTVNRLLKEVFRKSSEGVPEKARIGRFGNLTTFTIGKTQDQLDAEFQEKLKKRSRFSLPKPIDRTIKSIIQKPEPARTPDESPVASIFRDPDTKVQSLRSQIKSPTTERQTAAPRQKTPPPQKIDVAVKVEVDSKDPGLTSRPKSTEVQRQPGGL